ncbi:uncharacterized protein LOC131873940 [Cryptomeria japonica]|uniref:uncharacterized protein LOC131873940 n=1 Tax=Cryptomeria japonica TaxID=3369 RepID=UPI0027DA6321|nr:uncharacterized protein LOC131873940 [Cryptomeria japonica]
MNVDTQEVNIIMDKNNTEVHDDIVGSGNIVEQPTENVEVEMLTEKTKHTEKPLDSGMNTAEPICPNSSFVDVVPSLVSFDDNKMLMSPFMVTKVKQVIFSMGPDKAPGPNGYTTLFFQKSWDFLGNDIVSTLEESRRNRSILKEMNTTLIAIISKVDNPASFVDFWPISLCNTLYKIFTKAISIRLAKIIIAEQGGFVPGKETLNGEISSHEVLYSIVSQKLLAMMLKLDMMKAYDRVDWGSLCAILA